MDIQPGTVIKVAQKWLSNNVDVAMNVGYFYFDGASPLDAVLLVDDFVLWGTLQMDLLQTALSNTITLATIDVYERVGGVEELLGSRFMGRPGTGTSDPLPTGIAGLATAQVDGSKGVAKKFIPGLVEALTANGQWIPGAEAAILLVGLMWFFTQDASRVPGMLGVYKPITIKADRVPEERKIENNVRVSSIPAYQRRRKAGVGI